MNIDQLEVKLRQRGLWEAADLGFLLAQRHFVPLWLAWVAGALPVAILFGLILHKYPLWAVFVVWLFKPMYENVMLSILSKRIFGQNASLRPIFKSYKSASKGWFFYSLIVSRLTLNRSFACAVSLLEGQRGKARKQRLSQLSMSMQNITQFVTILLFVLESMLVWAFMLFLWNMFPSEFADHQVNAVVFSDLFIDWAYALSLFLVMSLVAPFYVSAGFALYLSRRTDLEAWDIELDFKKLNTRIEESKNKFGAQSAHNAEDSNGSNTQGGAAA